MIVVAEWHSPIDDIEDVLAWEDRTDSTITGDPLQSWSNGCSPSRGSGSG